MPIQVASSAVTSTDLASFQAGDADLLLASAEAAIRNFCNWHVYPLVTDEVMVADGSGARTLMLPTLRIVGVTSVTETTVDGSGAATTATLTEGADFDWAEAGYLIRLPYGNAYAQAWTTKLRGVTATITHGFENVPDDLRTVALGIAARASASPNGGIVQAGPFRYDPAKNADGSTGGIVLTEAEKAALRKYRIPAQP